MRIAINDEICTGHGRCYALAPDVFEPDDDGRGLVIVSDVPDELVAQANTAIAGCPERAIFEVEA